ncbi:MAG: hypothetical protein IT310_10210 [Anaerolineales bacterium]|nr:hypothetical protein [Anaerolineales bacterium]
MDFPITELMDREACIQWLAKYFHPVVIYKRIVSKAYSLRLQILHP